MARRVLKTKKLLVASIGVATVSYAACNFGDTTGNLVAPPPGNGTDAAKDVSPPPTSGNLVAPPPIDAGDDADDAGDAGDAEGDASDAGDAD